MFLQFSEGVGILQRIRCFLAFFLGWLSAKVLRCTFLGETVLQRFPTAAKRTQRKKVGLLEQNPWTDRRLEKMGRVINYDEPFFA